MERGMVNVYLKSESSRITRRLALRELEGVEGKRKQMITSRPCFIASSSALAIGSVRLKLRAVVKIGDGGSGGVA
jgi:hypothetical protein